MEDYYEYLDSNGVTTLYKLIKDDTVALIDSYSVTINGITTTLDTHINDSDIHTPISDIENMVDTKISGLVNSAPETLDTLKELSDALGSDPNFATTVANQIGTKADKDSVYTKQETDTLLEGKANSVHSHVVSDITDFPTIPTKLSQLENDMGFGTGGDTSDCVHKSGDETIDGNKFFIQDVNVKNSDVDIAVTPSNNLFSCFRFRGKGNVTTASIQYSQRTYGVNDICFYVSDADSNSHGFRIRTDNRLEPIENNTYSLGSSSSKWADVYSTNAHINYTYTNRVTTYSIAHPTDNSYFFMSGGSDYAKGATLYLGGVSATNFTPGRFALAARKTDGSSVELAGSPNGTLTWGGKNIGIDENLVHTSGNETINGKKTFTNQIYLGAGGTSYGQISAKDNNSILRLFGGTSPSTGANLDLYGENLSDGGFSLRARTSDKIVGLDGKTDGTLKWNGKNVALDENLVHKSGNEYINGTKIFSNTINRHADLTTSGVEQVYNFYDINTNSCGHIYNNVYWTGDAVYNRHGAYNNKSGKSMDIDIISPDSGVGMAYVSGTATKGNVEAVTSATGHTGLATMGWVNNPATSTNVVHRSGDETINGSKSFTSEIYRMNSAVDRTTTPSQNLYSTFSFLDKARLLVGSIQHCQRTSGVNDLSFYVTGNSNVSYGVRINSNKEFSPIENNAYSLGSAGNKWANVYATRINCDNIVRTNENSYIYMTAGPAWNSGASIFLNGKSGDGNGSGTGTFTLYARNASAERYLLGRPDGILKWTGCIEAQGVHSTNGNAFLAQNSSYTFLIRNDGSNTYFLMSDKDGVPGTWSTARPLTINNSTGVCNINGNANSATYSTTPATTDNSTKIATTAWVRNYVNSVAGRYSVVNSVAGSNAVGSSISAYYSNATTLTAEGSPSSSDGSYPSDYSDYINISPTVGTIYTGSQLFGTLNASASGSKYSHSPSGQTVYQTTAKATAKFSGAFSSSAKYLCTTANAVKFRAFVSQGTTSDIGTASVVDNSSTKSIFTRVE